MIREANSTFRQLSPRSTSAQLPHYGRSAAAAKSRRRHPPSSRMRIVLLDIEGDVRNFSQSQWPRHCTAVAWAIARLYGSCIGTCYRAVAELEGTVDPCAAGSGAFCD